MYCVPRCISTTSRCLRGVVCTMCISTTSRCSVYHVYQYYLQVSPSCQSRQSYTGPGSLYFFSRDASSSARLCSSSFCSFSSFNRHRVTQLLRNWNPALDGTITGGICGAAGTLHVSAVTGSERRCSAATSQLLTSLAHGPVLKDYSYTPSRFTLINTQSH